MKDRISVFIYDDDEGMLGAMRSCARRMEGTDVMACEDTKEVAAAFESAGSVHRAIIDKGARGMPGSIGWRGGLGVVKVLREKYDPAIMVVTGEGMTGIEEIKAAGANVFLSKGSLRFWDYLRQFIESGTITVRPEDVSLAGIL